MKAVPRLVPLLLSLFLLPPLALAGGDAPPDHAILKCRGLADTGARLACYDAIPVGSGPQAASVAAVAAATASTAPAREANFGIEERKRREAQPPSITSTIVGDFHGWGPSSQIRLANGQVWRIVDGSEAVLPSIRNPKITIERNMFGTLFLKVEGSNNSAKVRRVE